MSVWICCPAAIHHPGSAIEQLRLQLQPQVDTAAVPGRGEGQEAGRGQGYKTEEEVGRAEEGELHPSIPLWRGVDTVHRGEPCGHITGCHPPVLSFAFSQSISTLFFLWRFISTPSPTVPPARPGKRRGDDQIIGPGQERDVQ